MPDSSTVSVLVRMAAPRAYDYRVPADMRLAPGDIVQVPLGERQVTGVVWGPGGGDLARARLKAVAARCDVPPLPAALRRFVDWVAEYTLSPGGAVLRLALSVPEALAPEPVRLVCVAGPGAPERITASRRRVLETLKTLPQASASGLARAAGVGMSVVRGLLECDAVQLVPGAPVSAPPLPSPPPHMLSPLQEAAAQTLRAAVAAGGFAPHLLDGVTGSGKTDVYFEAIAQVLRAGGDQALIMLPEIALTAQFLDRFKTRFGFSPLPWHSGLTQAARREAWRDVARGRARVVVGARSALFLPFPCLGLIVVDEEHDGGFKQEEGVIYHARDMAVARAWLDGFAVVLSSATPALETVINVRRGRYGRLALPERHGGAQLPRVEMLDLRVSAPPRGRWLAPELVAALRGTLDAGEQALLFLNRRGYAPLTLCRECGHRLSCPHCDAWLVIHQIAPRRPRLLCHHCGHVMPPPRVCPGCGEAETLAPCGPGIERVAEEVALLCPGARRLLLSSDAPRGPDALRVALDGVLRGEVDVMIGTQVAAKGHHFPRLTLVGVVDADLGLGGGDLRAAERTFQVLHQVAGRAGRAERPGRVLVQSWMPHHPVMQALASGDRRAFLEREAEAREAAGLPPFGRLVAVIVSGLREDKVAAAAQALAVAAPRGGGVEVFGPAPAPLARLRGRHRMRLLLRARLGVNVQAATRDWLARAGRLPAVRVTVDVDPCGFL